METDAEARHIFRVISWDKEGNALINLYKAEYDRQHPKHGNIFLKIISLIIAVIAVLVVGSLDARAETEYSEICVSDEEYELLKRIVAAESQTQELEGRKAVVEVIFNRVLSKEFPDSVEGVLSQKGQFSTWRMRNDSWVEPEMAVEAIDAVMKDGRTVLPDTEYLFFSRGKSRYAKDYIKIQDHWFGRAR